MASAWHKHTTYDTIIIRQYTSLLNCSLDHLDRKDTPSEVKTIKEPEQINTILQMLDILPSEGGIMKSFADTIDYMVLELWL